MIAFRWWYCNRRHSRPEAEAGRRFACGCRHKLKVPHRSGGRCRVRTPLDWLVEVVVYGGGGGLIGFVTGLMVARFVYVGGVRWKLIAGLTVAGFLVGAVGGEPGINWLGRLVRERVEG
jgi:hypothetical protein